MDNFINFLTNFRNNAAQWEKDLNSRANKALSDIGNGVSAATNQAVNAMATPFRAAGNELSNATNQLVQSAGQTINALNQNVATPVVNKMAQAGTAVNNATGINNARLVTGNILADTTNALSNAQQPNATAGGKTYQRDQGIDTFISMLRTIMNPLRGITGETPLDIIVNNTADSLYSKFGKEVTPSTKGTQTATIDGSGVTKEPATETATTTTASATKPTETTDVVTYTYKPGDTFGQVIQDLGLTTSNGLWGAGGDVEYYTRQLINQGALDRNGNIPIGTTIRLTRRK